MTHRLTANINYPIVLRTLGYLLIIEACFMMIPLAVSLFYNDDGIKGIMLSFVITLTAGVFMTYGITPARKEFSTREAILLTASVWLLFSLFGMLPFIFCKPRLGVIDALFEAVSGFTTTGATVILNVEELSHGVLMWRALMHWLGGMGIILFTLAVLPILNYQGGIKLFNAEVSGITQEKLRPRVGGNAKSIWTVYIILTLCDFLLLLLGPMSIFDALCHSMSTVATGGFSTKNASIAYWGDWYTTVVTMVFMFLGGVNFQLIYLAATGRYKALLHNDTFHWYIVIILVVYLTILSRLLYEGYYDTWQEYAVYPLFQVISGITSTGFFADSFEKWGDAAHILIMMIMFFGACAGSTTSGAKIDRLMVLLKNTKYEFFKLLHPNSVKVLRVNGKVLPPEVVYKVIAFLAVALMIICISSLTLAMCGYDFQDSLFASISCLSNIGYGVGFTGDNGSFYDIVWQGKIVLMFLMITGRLEIFTFLVVFTKYFWQK